MDEAISKDRRHAPRRPTLVRVKPLDGGAWMTAQDLGLGGMLVTTEQPRWPGAFVPVRFSLQRGETPIEVVCQVVDLVEVPRGIGLALRFVRFSKAGRARLGRFLQDRIWAS
ncbi:MAG: PilZ domain-containing protein [Myxococcota bacterium]|jgi:hypothetical protein|nr:PilZ domain-containing protein [Myxococcota bacterium]